MLWYGYVGNNPLSKVDPMGLEAAEFYNSLGNPEADTSFEAYEEALGTGSSGSQGRSNDNGGVAGSTMPTAADVSKRLNELVEEAKRNGTKNINVHDLDRETQAALWAALTGNSIDTARAAGVVNFADQIENIKTRLAAENVATSEGYGALSAEDLIQVISKIEETYLRAESSNQGAKSATIVMGATLSGNLPMISASALSVGLQLKNEGEVNPTDTLIDTLVGGAAGNAIRTVTTAATNSLIQQGYSRIASFIAGQASGRLYTQGIMVGSIELRRWLKE